MGGWRAIVSINQVEGEGLQQLMINLACNQTLVQNQASRGAGGQHYNYTLEIDRFLESSIPSSISTRYPMQRILREVCKLLHFNLFEAALLHWMLRSANLLPKREDKSMTPAIAELVKFDEFTFDCKQYATVFASVLFNAYYVKSFVSSPECMAQHSKEVCKMCPSFPQCFEKWPKHQSLKLLSLPMINEIFAANMRTSTEKDIDLNYNIIVDQILDLAKPYNVGGAKEEPEKEPEDDQEDAEPDGEACSKSEIIEPAKRKKVKAEGDKKQPKDKKIDKRKKPGKEQTNVDKKPNQRLASSGKSFESPTIKPETKPMNKTILESYAGNGLRRSVRKQQQFISSQQQDLDIFNRRNAPMNDSNLLMLESRRSEANQDMFKSVDSRWSSIYKFESRRTVNNESFGLRRLGESLTMNQTKTIPVAPALKPPPPDLSLRRVDSEEL